MRKHYTPAEVAEIVGVTRKTVYAWIHSGHLPAVRMGPKLWHVLPAQLEALTAGQEARPPAAAPPVVDSGRDLGRSGGGGLSMGAATGPPKEDPPSLRPMPLKPARRRK